LDEIQTFVASQGGDTSVIDHPERLPQAALSEEVTASRDGVAFSDQSR